MLINEEDNIFFNDYLMQYVKDYTDEKITAQLEIALDKGWNIKTIYGEKDNFYNALHACALHGKINSCIWLIEKGVIPYIKSGNDSTAFTFMLEAICQEKIDIENFINFAKKIKDYGGNLSLSGYEKNSPLEIYSRFNNQLDERIINLLIENTNFEKDFNFNSIIKEDKYFNFKVLKKIYSNGKINLKEFTEIDENNKSTNSYWNSIAFYLNGKHGKTKFVFIDWLHNKSGFDLDQIHIINKNLSNGLKENFKFNLLGLAIKSKNKTMFKWIMKKRPNFVKDKFTFNNKDYELLEFSLLCDFRHGAQFILKKMNTQELLAVNLGNLKDLCSGYKKTSETFEKTYTSVLYKKMSEKYKSKDITTQKYKI